MPYRYKTASEDNHFYNPCTDNREICQDCGGHIFNHPGPNILPIMVRQATIPEGALTLTLQVVYDPAPLLARQCSNCNSQEFRRIIWPESSFQLLNTITPCPSCKVDLQDYHRRRSLPIEHNYGLAMCLGCNRIVALV